MDTNIVLIVLRIFVSTNLQPGWVGGATAVTNADGWLSQSVPLRLVRYAPKWVVQTNYVVGIRMNGKPIELLTLHADVDVPLTNAPTTWIDRDPIGRTLVSAVEGGKLAAHEDYLK